MGAMRQVLSENGAGAGVTRLRESMIVSAFAAGFFTVRVGFGGFFFGTALFLNGPAAAAASVGMLMVVLMRRKRKLVVLRRF